MLNKKIIQLPKKKKIQQPGSIDHLCSGHTPIMEMKNRVGSYLICFDCNDLAATVDSSGGRPSKSAWIRSLLSKQQNSSFLPSIHTQTA